MVGEMMQSEDPDRNEITIYRGQLSYFGGPLICPMLRTPEWPQDQRVIRTAAKLRTINDFLTRRHQLTTTEKKSFEYLLWEMQRVTERSACVSFSFDWHIAKWAGSRSPGGVVLVVKGPASAGLDFNKIRSELGFTPRYQNAAEFGVLERVGPPYELVSVHPAESFELLDERVQS